MCQKNDRLCPLFYKKRSRGKIENGSGLNTVCSEFIENTDAVFKLNAGLDDLVI